jgi:pSer/pThr/pTyr-binding forkhead associated (FHA) protein
LKFGALTVVLPSGEQREFGLDLASALLGRGEGCTIVVDDLSIARRHARVSVEAGRLFLEDLGSATGTFIGEERIPAHTPSLVEPWHEIRFGNLSAFFKPPAAIHSEPSAPLTERPDEDTGAPRELAPSIWASLSLPPVPIDPGSSPAVGTLLVQNRGNVVDELTIEVLGVPKEWVRLSADKVVLVPDAQAEVTVVVQPPRRPDSTAGEHDLSLVVTSVENSRQVLSTSRITLVQFDETTLALHPIRSRKNFRLDVENRGNAAATYSLTGNDDEEAFSYRFESPSSEVPAGEKRSVQFRVSPRKHRWFGQVGVGPYKVTAAAGVGGPQGAADGQLLIRPTFQPYQRPAMLLLVLSAITVGILAYFFWPFPFWPFDRWADDALVKAATPESAYAGVHMCDKGEEDAKKDELARIADVKPGLAPYYSQNDPAWGNVEYAKAKDPDFTPDWCGTTIEQCGCALTSVATIMSLFQVVAMPDGAELNPQTVNEWFNRQATKTSKGWVSQGYIYGDVIWTAVNQLSGEIAKARPGTPTVRFARIGTGSDEEIRTELQAGRFVILEVPGHFIAAVGIEGDKILINDPYYRDRKTLNAYTGKVKSSVLFETSSDLSGVVITAPRNVRLKVTDKQGRVVGTLNTGSAEDAAKGAQAGIPGSSYTTRAAWRDPTCVESPPPADAGTNQIVLPGTREDYTVEVLEVTGGATSVAIHSYDQKGEFALTTKDSTGGAVLAVSYDPTKAGAGVTVIQGGSPTPQGGGSGPAGGTPTEQAGGGTNGGQPGAGGSPGASATAPGGSVTPVPGAKSPTATPTPTPTPTPVVAPAILSLACTTTYTPLPKNATVSCTTTVDALSEHISWTVNGVTSPGGNDKASFSVSGFNADLTLTIGVKSCNKDVCNTKSQAVKVAFPTVGPAATPTPGGPATPVPTGTPTAVSQVTVTCLKSYPPPSVSSFASISCSAIFSGAYTYIIWAAPGATPSGEISGSTEFHTSADTFSGPVRIPVTATVCNGPPPEPSAPDATPAPGGPCVTSAPAVVQIHHPVVVTITHPVDAENICTGEAYAFTVVVTPDMTTSGAPPPTGLVQFYINSDPFGPPVYLGAGGVAVMTFIPSAAGPFELYATYGGSEDYLGGESGILTTAEFVSC